MNKRGKLALIILSIFIIGAICFMYMNMNKVDVVVYEFSYEEDYKYFCEGLYSGRMTGFKNTTKKKIKTVNQAIRRAKNEVTIPYNHIIVCYDEECEMWLVSFGTKGTNDGCQNVYLDSDGLTKIISYGG